MFFNCFEIYCYFFLYGIRVLYIMDFFQVNVLVVELKLEALKERYWKQLIKKLNVRWVLLDFILGYVWDVDLIRYELIVRDIIFIVQGEMVFEEFLKQVCNCYI